MPPDILKGDWGVGAAWRAHGAPAQRAILPTVLKFFLQSFAYNKAHVGGESQVTRIEQSVQIAAKQKPIVDSVQPAFRVGPHMGSFKNGQDPLAGNCAPALICVGHQEAERSLPKARANQRRIAESRYLSFEDLKITQGCLQGVEQCQARFDRQVVAASLNDIRFPIIWNPDPAFLGEKKRLRQ